MGNQEACLQSYCRSCRGKSCMLYQRCLSCVGLRGSKVFGLDFTAFVPWLTLLPSVHLRVVYSSAVNFTSTESFLLCHTLQMLHRAEPSSTSPADRSLRLYRSLWGKTLVRIRQCTVLNFLFLFDTGSYCVSLETWNSQEIHLPLPSRCWD